MFIVANNVFLFFKFMSVISIILFFFIKCVSSFVCKQFIIICQIVGNLLIYNLSYIAGIAH